MEMVFTFANTNYSVKAEQTLLRGGLDVRVMPLPASIRAGCGLCLRVAPEDADRGAALLAEADVPIEGRWRRWTENGKSRYTPED